MNHGKSGFRRFRSHVPCEELRQRGAEDAAAAAAAEGAGALEAAVADADAGRVRTAVAVRGLWQVKSHDINRQRRVRSFKPRNVARPELAQTRLYTRRYGIMKGVCACCKTNVPPRGL